jgi:hypothetical protein
MTTTSKERRVRSTNHTVVATQRATLSSLKWINSNIYWPLSPRFRLRFFCHGPLDKKSGSGTGWQPVRSSATNRFRFLTGYWPLRSLYEIGVRWNETPVFRGSVLLVVSKRNTPRDGIIGDVSFLEVKQTQHIYHVSVQQAETKRTSF